MKYSIIGGGQSLNELMQIEKDFINSTYVIGLNKAFLLEGIRIDKLVFFDISCYFDMKKIVKKTYDDEAPFLLETREEHYNKLADEDRKQVRFYSDASKFTRTFDYVLYMLNTYNCGQGDEIFLWGIDGKGKSFVGNEYPANFFDNSNWVDVIGLQNIKAKIYNMNYLGQKSVAWANISLEIYKFMFTNEYAIIHSKTGNEYRLLDLVLDVSDQKAIIKAYYARPDNIHIKFTRELSELVVGFIPKYKEYAECYIDFLQFKITEYLKVTRKENFDNTNLLATTALELAKAVWR